MYSPSKIRQKMTKTYYDIISCHYPKGQFIFHYPARLIELKSEAIFKSYFIPPFMKPFNFDLLNFLEKTLELVFRAFSSDQAFWDFLDFCSTFSAVYNIRLVNKKEYYKKSIFDLVYAVDSIINF